ncbi:MAG: NAD(P)/FAD-dependent oxidoreductase [Acutalibacteraceae bacterium]|nr:NAD(P)/FAD-dependent oxidoreductase [Acutalibacteraceae bacterium]
MNYDVAVIGAGVIGSLIARELSRYNIKVAILEKCNDMAMGTSKANSAIVHAGYDAKPGSLKAKLNVEGAALMPELCKTLAVPFKPVGSLVVAFSDEEVETLGKLLERGKTNGVPGLEIYNKEKLTEAEPHISDEAKAALWAPSAGIVCPYELTIAAVENAVVNGADFIRNFEVDKIDFDGEIFTVSSKENEIKTKFIINAAGVYCDEIASLIGDNSVHTTPRKGEYMLCDKSIGHLANHTIFQCPSKMGKGILVTPTVDGNLLIGPSAIDIEDKEDVATCSDTLADVLEAAKKSVPCVTTRDVITSFAGLRAHCDRDDFIIEPSEKNGQFINVAGIESPGLSSAPAIAVYVKDILLGMISAEEKSDFNPVREEPVRFRHMSNEERKALIEKNPAYGRIICRCETITEGEILDAINSPAGARDVDGVKRRTRAGMGRCQGGFSGSKVVELLARELGVEINEITKFGGNSRILYDRTK